MLENVRVRLGVFTIYGRQAGQQPRSLLQEQQLLVPQFGRCFQRL